MSQKIKIGIDASRCRSGGAIAHIIGILNVTIPTQFEVHLWTYEKLSKMIHGPVVKHSHPYINKNIFYQIFFQKFILKKQLSKNNIDILFSADMNTVCNFSPMVFLNQDLLAFSGLHSNPDYSLVERARFLINKYLSIYGLNNSSGGIFLSNFSKNLVLKNNLKDKHHLETEIIPHGVSMSLRKYDLNQFLKKNVINITYVSNITPYKNHHHVINAIGNLEIEKKCIINFIGGGKEGSKYYKKIMDLTKSVSKKNTFISFNSHKFLSAEKVEKIVLSSDIYIFASSIESFGITLLEGMRHGIPIICSEKSSLPEVLGLKGIYFDPTKSEDITRSINFALNNPQKMIESAQYAYDLSYNFSWETCSKKTFNFISKVFHNQK